jgi:tetratricopeptide (TPR) repeat protein
MEEFISKAKDLLDKDDPVLARAELEKAALLDEHPQGNWEIHWLMARSYLKELPYAATKDALKGLLNRASDQMKKALSACRDVDTDKEDRQNKIKCLICLGRICLLKKDYSEAISHLRAAKSEADANLKPCIGFLLGLAYLRHKMYDQSKSAFDEISKELSPCHVFTWEKIPGEHDGILKCFLIKQFSEDWKYIDKIEKAKDGKTITVSAKGNSKSLNFKDDKVEIETLRLDVIEKNGEHVTSLKPPLLGEEKGLKCSSEIFLDPEEFKIDSDYLLYTYANLYIYFSDLERHVMIEEIQTRLKLMDNINDDLIKSHREHCWGWWYLNKSILKDKPNGDQRIASIGNIKLDKVTIIDGKLSADSIAWIGKKPLTNAHLQKFKIQEVNGIDVNLVVEAATIKEAQVDSVEYDSDQKNKSDQESLHNPSVSESSNKPLNLKRAVLRSVEFETAKGIEIQHESTVNLAIEHLQISLGLRADHYAYLHLAQAYELQMIWEKDETKKAIMKRRAKDACQRCIDLDRYDEHAKEAQDLMKRLEGSQSSSSPPQQAKKEEDKTKGEGADKAGSSEAKKTGG